MRQLIAGNWKMNGRTADGLALATRLAEGATGLGCDLLICPPATLLTTLAAALTGSSVMLGGQDCHALASGANTGDVSAPMLWDAGARWAIVGHSERRVDHGETDAMVQVKAIAAASCGLIPIVCVGESAAQRRAGEAPSIVAAQLAGSLPAGFAGVVAYEPVWAIGTGLTPTVADVAAMHCHIRVSLVEHLGEAGRGLRILYGGSVKPGNAAELLAVLDVGGALVGGASLVAADFLAIARAAAPAVAATTSPG